MGSSALLGKSFYTSSLLPKFELSGMSLKNALKSAENERSTIRDSWAEHRLIWKAKTVPNLLKYGPTYDLRLKTQFLKDYFRPL